MSLQTLLKGKRVKLSNFTEGDALTISQWYQDSRFARLFDGTPSIPKTETQISEWLKEVDESGNDYLFSIRLIEDDHLIGLIELDGIIWNNGVAGVAIGIGNATERRSGYGREALALALDFAFMELNLHRIQLTVFSYNEGAVKLYEKMGFRREGCYRDFIHRDGKRFDMYLYGLLRHEWEQVFHNKIQE